MNPIPLQLWPTSLRRLLSDTAPGVLIIYLVVQGLHLRVDPLTTASAIFLLTMAVLLGLVSNGLSWTLFGEHVHFLTVAIATRPWLGGATRRSLLQDAVQEFYATEANSPASGRRPLDTRHFIELGVQFDDGDRALEREGVTVEHVVGLHRFLRSLALLSFHAPVWLATFGAPWLGRDLPPRPLYRFTVVLVGWLAAHVLVNAASRAVGARLRRTVRGESRQHSVDAWAHLALVALKVAASFAFSRAVVGLPLGVALLCCAVPWAILYVASEIKFYLIAVCFHSYFTMSLTNDADANVESLSPEYREHCRRIANTTSLLRRSFALRLGYADSARADAKGSVAGAAEGPRPGRGAPDDTPSRAVGL